MLDTLITSKTRIKLLLKFFLNSNSNSYLRALESEFGESSNAIRLELNRFEDAGLLKSNFSANKKIFNANTSHPLFNDIHNILLKYIGLDHIIDEVVIKLGKVKFVYLLGDFAKGKDGKIIDLLFVGENIDRDFLLKLIDKAEKLIKRKIRFLLLGEDESEKYIKEIDKSELLLLWK
ncbi:MAG: ArsR family transcriptional regulator, partial [Bacteroidota bacterium]|nr:ArsR family transcriptional regulator [Bacteroidota bacterium]